MFKQTHRSSCYREIAISSILLVVASPGLCGEGTGALLLGNVDEITVTARRKPESTFEVPIALTRIDGRTLRHHGARQFIDYATAVPNLAFTYGGGPTGVTSARSIAIRGVGGQNFLGTASAAGLYIDETAVPSSIDPWLLDVSAIEVLRGPQGTLYGASSLGGNIRVVTQAPELDKSSFGYIAAAGPTSGGESINGELGLVGNLALLPKTFAVRASLYGRHDAGYLTRTYPAESDSPASADPSLTVARISVGNQGSSFTRGGSICASWQTAPRLTLKARAIFQDRESNGFAAAFAPLPDFEPHYQLDRAFDIQPRARDRWRLASLDLNYLNEGWALISSISYFDRNAIDAEDATYGTQQVLSGYYETGGVPIQPYIWIGARAIRQTTAEVRLRFDARRDLTGQIGTYYARAHSSYDTPPTYARGLSRASQSPNRVGTWPNDLLWTIHNPSSQEDFSLFGELEYRFAPQLVLTLGARRYWLRQSVDNIVDGFLNFGATPSDPQSNEQSGLSPKVALAYQRSRESLVYVSASQGFRAGGAQANLPFCSLPGLSARDITHLKSDTLLTYEAGARLRMPESRLILSAAAFRIDWSDFQQLVTLPCGAFVSINGKRASIRGGELDITRQVSQRTLARIGVGYERSIVEDPGNLGLVGLQRGSRLLGVPQWTSSLSVEHVRPVTGALSSFVSLDFSYRASSVSILNAGAGALATAAGYHVLNARVGVRWEDSDVTLSLRNLTNQRPNLGDIGYNGYAQFRTGSSASGVIPVVATMQPMTAVIAFTHNL